MKTFIFLLAVIFPLVSFSSVDLCREFNSLDSTQHYVLRKAYDYGTNHDLGYTMASIAMVESNAGKYLVNASTQDFGVFHINLKYAALRDEVYTEFGRNVLAQELIFNIDLNARHALDTLLYFQDYHKGDWRKTVASYNAGFDHHKGRGYMLKVVKWIKVLQVCIDYEQGYGGG